MPGDGTEPSMSRGWLTLSSDSYVRIPLHLGCQAGISNFMRHTWSSRSWPSPALLADRPASSDNSNALLPGPQLQSLRLLSFSHISCLIHQKMSCIFKIHPNSSSSHHLHCHHPSPTHHHLLPVFLLQPLRWSPRFHLCPPFTLFNTAAGGILLKTKVRWHLKRTNPWKN